MLRSLCALAVLCSWSLRAGAVPTGEELVGFCERAVAADFHGVDAAVCEWHAYPCECKFTLLEDPEVPRWCLPAGVSMQAVIEAVIGRLRTDSRNKQPADEVVPHILSELYPCEQ